MIVTDRGLAAIRARADRILADTVTVTREGAAVTGPTGNVTRPTETIYTGRALVTAPKGTDAEDSEPGRKHRVEDDYRCRLPLAAAANETGDPGAIAPGDIVTVSASQDPGMDGRTFSVTSVLVQTYAANRRLTLTAYTTKRRT